MWYGDDGGSRQVCLREQQARACLDYMRSTFGTYYVSYRALITSPKLQDSLTLFYRSYSQGITPQRFAGMCRHLSKNGTDALDDFYPDDPFIDTTEHTMYVSAKQARRTRKRLGSKSVKLTSS